MLGVAAGLVAAGSAKGAVARTETVTGASDTVENARGVEAADIGSSSSFFNLVFSYPSLYRFRASETSMPAYFNCRA